MQGETRAGYERGRREREGVGRRRSVAAAGKPLHYNISVKREGRDCKDDGEKYTWHRRDRRTSCAGSSLNTLEDL